MERRAHGDEPEAATLSGLAARLDDRVRLSTAVRSIDAEAGVVTRRVEETASQAGHVFAVDPTSLDAEVGKLAAPESAP